MYIDYFLCRIGGSDSGASCLYLVRRVINRGIVEKKPLLITILNVYWMAGFSFRRRCQKTLQYV